MSDFETRLGDALSSGAEGAPDVTGLADGARRRARRRRTTYAGVAAVAVVAVAVPVGVVALSGGSDPVDNGRADDPVAVSTTRVETWHDISVEVPVSWGYGSRSQHCVGGDAKIPVVERPGGVTTLVMCVDPAIGYGVSFSDTSLISPVYESGHVWQYEAGDIEQYEPGSWLGYWYEGKDLVEVNAGDKETVQEVIDSVERVDGTDANGCPVMDDGGAGDVADDEVSVCRYSAEGDLEQSELLVGDEAAEAKAAIEGAPLVDAANDCANADGEHVVMTADGVRAEVQYTGIACSDRGLFIGDEVRQLTEDVLFWALSPGWTGYAEPWVPLPDPLRTLPTPEPTEAPVTDGLCLETISPETDLGLAPDNGEPMTVCRYVVDYDAESGGAYLLNATSELSASESDEVRAALEAAPVQAESLSLDCAGGRGESFVVYAGDSASMSVYNGECGSMTVSTADGLREPTAELLDALGSPYGLLR
jgi:hypothetical protein